MTDKGKILVFPHAAPIEAEAAAWVARFDAGDVSARDLAAFQEWLNRSALHREAIAEYGSLWSAFDALRLPAGGNEPGRRVPAPRRRAIPVKRAKLRLAAYAAAVIAVAGGGALFNPAPLDPAAVENLPPVRASYETAIGSQKRITLADGSSVILNTNSRLDVDFFGNRRDVHLMRGEAYFEVVHNKARPFTVYANNYVVRDIGTAFDVHLSKAGLLEVGVTKGSVEVAPVKRTHAAKGLGVVAAGHAIVLGPKVERAEVMSSADMGRKLAWRQGELIYTGQPLGQVLGNISRYSNIKIEVADPALEKLPVGGAFRIDQIAAIISALENNFGVHAEWIDPQHVRLTSSREKSPSRD